MVKRVGNSMLRCVLKKSLNLFGTDCRKYEENPKSCFWPCPVRAAPLLGSTRPFPPARISVWPAVPVPFPRLPPRGTGQRGRPENPNVSWPNCVCSVQCRTSEWPWRTQTRATRSERSDWLPWRRRGCQPAGDTSIFHPPSENYRKKTSLWSFK